MADLEIKILSPEDQKLKQISTEVTDFDNPIYQQMIDKMKEICIQKKAYASAAPQFGILKRFILIMTEEEMRAKTADELEKLKIDYTITPYFNPRITLMRGRQYFLEACMSVDKIAGKVARPYYMEMEAQDIHGNWFTKVAEGFEAIILCHEIDHLDGIEFIDKAETLFYDVDREKRLALRQQYPYEVVSKEGEFLQGDIDSKVRTSVYKQTMI